MKKTPLYSRSGRPASASAPAAPVATPNAPAPHAAGESAAPLTGAVPAPASALPPAPTRRARWAAAARRGERWLWLLLAIGLAAAAGWPAWQANVVRPLTIKQIDKAMRESLVKERLPSASALAAEAVRGSVVRVVGYQDAAPGKAKPIVAPKNPTPGNAEGDEEDDDDTRSVGTGVVIIDNGTILTNLHVVRGARRIQVTFADGHQSEAVLMGAQPEHDLAVLRARSIPDDLQAATMRSTSDLQPGDEVVAVGFPFGIGPSVSAGVVSGLKRDFRSPEGKQVLSNLIQFDAAANPGNSGGPLVTMDGHVVGIVTAIMNPTEHATFLGIGFAVPIENAAAGAGLPPF